MRRAVRRARRAGRVVALGARLGTLGKGRGRLKVFCVTVLLGARHILKRPGERLFALRVSVGGSTRTLVVSDYGELEVMRDILLDGEYSLADVPAPAVIVDVGANIGLATLYFRARYPQARIVAIEPDPATFAKLARNVGADPLTRVVNAAVSNQPGELVLFRPPGYSIASSLKRREHGNGDVRVRADTLDHLCEELDLPQVDLLKLDVEGAEVDVLRGFSRLAEVPLVIGEAHPRLLGDGIGELFALLRDFEVRRVSETEDAIAFVATRQPHE